MNIYEIGCLTKYHRDNEFYKGLNWRKELDEWAESCYIYTYNPAIVFLKETNQTYNTKLCVDQNDYYIHKCDIAVANLTDIEYSPGSIYELVRFKELRKPVIAFGKSHWSPHINSCISHQCETLEDVKEILVNMFDQGNIINIKI